MKSRFALAALLCLGACSSAPPASNPSPDAGVLRAAEIRASGGADLYGVIATRRPGWLMYAVDSLGQPAEETVIVFVDGRQVGDVRSLRGMATDQVASAQLRGADYVRGTTPALTRERVNAGIYVSVAVPRAVQAQAAGRRAGVYLSAGAAVAGAPGDQANVALDDAGYATVSDAGAVGSAEVDALLVQGGAWYRLAGPLQLRVDAARVFGTGVFGEKVPSPKLRGEVGSVEVDGMLAYSREIGPGEIHVGAGPAMRWVDSRWGAASRAEDVRDYESSTSNAFGWAATVGGSARIGSRTRVELQGFARRYSAQSIGHVQNLLDGVTIEGTTTSLNLGVGYDLF